MKKIFLTMTSAVFLLICINGLQAQTTQTQLNQLELFKQFLGTWQADVGKDTVEVWDCQEYGKAFIINVYQVIKDQKTPSYINNVGFDSRDGKLKGYVLWRDGAYLTWIGLYNSEKKFSVDIVDNFVPEKVWEKFEMGYINPKERTWTEFNKDGVKISEVKFVKVK
jgi:hypothetical protein